MFRREPPSRVEVGGLTATERAVGTVPGIERIHVVHQRLRKCVVGDCTLAEEHIVKRDNRMKMKELREGTGINKTRKDTGKKSDTEYE